jgi:hypothetical protein
LEALLCRRITVNWFHRFGSALSFLTRGSYYPPTVHLQPFDHRFILPNSISPSEFLRSDSRSPPFRVRDLLPGFRPSSRLHRCASTATKVTKPSLRSVLRRSQPLDGLLRASALQAYFIPQPRPGLRSFRVFSLAAATLLHQKETPPSSSELARSPAETDAHDRVPRPRGLYPRRVAFLRFGG